MMMLNLRRVVIAMPAALLLFVAAAHGQDLQLQLGETGDATFGGQGITAAHSVTQLGLTPASPNILKFGQNITVTFNYDTTQVGGVRIFVRPISIDPVTGADMLTPNYAACPSPIYPIGSGAGSCTFTITDVNATVEKIRIQMLNADQSVLLYNIKLPVMYKFR